MYKRYFYSITYLAVFLTISACVSAPRFTSRYERYRYQENQEKVDERDSVEIENLDSYKNAEVLESVTGIASFYADKYNGKVTYNGEIYDMYGISAAHPTYQMGTIIRVTNLSNDKNIIMRINDRMPYRPDRIIDLSLGVAQELGFVTAGLAEVKVDVLKWGTGKK